MRAALRTILVLALCGAGAGAAPAEGIDCRAARAPVDRAICADPGLLEQDAALARAFDAGLARDPAGAPALRRDQLAWLTARNRDCARLACVARHFAARIAALAEAPNAEPAPAMAADLPPVEPGAATLDAARLPVAPRMETLLRVTAPGRFAIAAKSASGVALQLVDMMAGPSELVGQPGSEDGRIDMLLDRGTYKLRAFAAEGATGEVVLSVTPFREVAPAGRLEAVTGELDDLQQRSFWLTVAPGDTLHIEAAGRALGRIALWRDGRLLMPIAPEARLVAPTRGHPLSYMRLAGALPPGTYRLTAYGGRALAWADDTPARPFHLRVAPSPALAAGWVGGAIGPFGNEVFILPATAAELRLDLPQPAEVQLMLENGAVTAIGRNTRTPTARLAVPAAQGPRVVELSGAEGQPFQLRRLDAGAAAAVVRGESYLTAPAAGFGGDEPPASVVFLRRSGTAAPAILAAQAPRVGPGLAWRQRFNLRGPVRLVFEATAPGPLAVRAEGVAVRADVAPVGSQPAWRADGAPATRWTVAAGWHELWLTPAAGAAGIIDVTLGPPGLAAEPATQPADPAFPLGLVALAAGERLETYASQALGARIGLAARLAPVDLAAGPLTVTQVSGAPLEVPVRLPIDGTLAVLQIGGGAVDAAFTAEPGPMPGRIGLVRVAATDRARTLALSWTAPPPPAPAVRAPAPEAALPVLAAGTPRYLDMKSGETQAFALDVPQGGLFRLETLGRLRTAGAIGTGFIPELDRAEANGIGQNLLIQRFLRAGSYRLEATALDSAGRMGVVARPAILRAGATLVPGGSVRAAIGADEGVAFPIEIAQAGRYRLDMLSLARGAVARLEDAEGWPLGPATALAPLEQDLAPGRYRLLVQPAGIAARVVARLARLEPVVALAGHGPFPLAFGTTSRATWREPPGRADARVPDEWRFDLAGAAAVTLGLGDGMVADLVSDQWPVTRFTRQFQGMLPAGSYRLRTASLGRNDRLDYSVSLASEELQPGRPRNVRLPASLAFEIAADRVAGITSFGATPLRAVLKRADGTVVERLGDRGADWNIGFSRLLPAGRYVLDLASAVPGKGRAVRPPDMPANAGSDDSQEGQDGDAAAEPERTDDAPAADEPSADAQPSEAPPGTVEVTLAVPEERAAVPAAAAPMRLEGGGVHRVALPAAEGLTVVAAASTAELVLALERRDEAGAWRTVSVAQGTAPVVGVLGGAGWRAAAWTLDGGREPIRLGIRAGGPGPVAFEGMPQTLVVAALPAGDAPLRAPGEALLNASAPGAPLVPVEGGVILPQGPRVWLLGRVVPDRLDPLPVAANAPLSLAIPAGVAAILPGPAGGVRLWLAESGLGQPAIEAGHGMGVAPGSAVALASGPARITGAGGAALRLRATALDLAPPAPRALATGFAAPIVPGEPVALRLPAAAGRVRVDLAPGLVAVANWRDAAAITLWGGPAALSRTIEGEVAELLLVNPGTAPAPAAVTWAARDATPAALGPGVAVKRFFGAAGSLDLPVTGPGRLVVAGGQATLRAGNAVLRGRSLPIPGPGRVVLDHGPGLMAAWVEGEGASPWPVPTPVRTPLPAAVALSGPAMAVALAPPSPALLHASSTAPVILALGDGPPELFPAGAELHRVVAGPALLRVISPHDGPLAGTLVLGAEPIVPAGDGVGATVALAPGESAAFGFEVARAGPVGVGIRAEPDTVAVRLLDGGGRLVGEGIAQLQRLAAGRYVLEARAAPAGGTVLVRPAVIGIAPRGTLPPQDVINRYLELAGRAPVLVSAPGRAP